MSMFIGEALVGDGNEVAHIDLLIGDKAGPVGHAFANALANQSKGHTNLLAVIAPNLICKPATVLAQPGWQGYREKGVSLSAYLAAVSQAWIWASSL